MYLEGPRHQLAAVTLTHAVVYPSWRDIVLIAGHVAIALFFAMGSERVRSDFVRFWQIASAQGRPYLDYPVEYPPITLGVFKVVARVARTPSMFAAGRAESRM